MFTRNVHVKGISLVVIIKLDYSYVLKYMSAGIHQFMR